MSWSFYTEVHDPDALDALADRIIAGDDTPAGVTVGPMSTQQWESEEHQAQLRAAIAAARALLAVTGRDGDQYHLNLNGHGNPGFAPTEGWSDCAITVSVRQIPHEKIEAE